MTFEVILIKMKYLRIHNISIHIIFCQNRFINECVRKNVIVLVQFDFLTKNVVSGKVDFEAKK